LEFFRNMDKRAVTAVPIHPLIADRWSPRSFSESATLSDHDLLAILEAGRWAPSASNAQPWRFFVGRRGDEVFDAIQTNLMGFNQAWTANASALILVAATKETPGGKPIKTASLDAGLAISSMSIQAQSLGLHTHPMAGFHHEKMLSALHAPVGLEAFVIIAVGTQAPAENFEGEAYEREIAERSRFPLSQIVLAGLPV
jgi:nitroreductase